MPPDFRDTGHFAASREPDPSKSPRKNHAHRRSSSGSLARTRRFPRGTGKAQRTCRLRRLVYRPERLRQEHRGEPAGPPAALDGAAQLRARRRQRPPRPERRRRPCSRSATARSLPSGLGWVFRPRTARRTSAASAPWRSSSATPGLIAITAFISPYRIDRDRVRASLADGDFVEIFVDAPIEVCAKPETPRDFTKRRGLGNLRDLRGLTIPTSRR